MKKKQKNIKPIKTFTNILAALVFVALGAFGFWIYQEKITQKPKISTSIVLEEQRDKKKSRFNLEQIRVGDKLNQLTVTSIEPFNVSYGELSENNVKISFKGKIKVDGTYLLPEEGQLKGIAFFEPSKNSLDTKIPRLEKDEKTGIYLIFDNQDFAKNTFAFKKDSTQTTIIIDNLTLVYYPSETKHSAELVEVLN